MTMRRVLTAGAMLVLVSLAIIVLRNDEAAPQSVSPAPQNRSPAPQKSSAAGSEQPERAASPSGASQPASSAVPARDSLEGLPALVAPQLSELSTTESPDLANRLGALNTKPEAEAKIVLDLLKLYRRLFGAYPAGENNSQFVNALLGANKEKVPLLPHDHPRLNAKGELVDAWGTPFFFHQNSRNSVEVRSVGADQRLFTEDDLVAGKPPAALERSVASDDVEPSS